MQAMQNVAERFANVPDEIESEEAPVPKVILRGFEQALAKYGIDVHKTDGLAELLAKQARHMYIQGRDVERMATLNLLAHTDLRTNPNVAPEREIDDPAVVERIQQDVMGVIDQIGQAISDGVHVDHLRELVGVHLDTKKKGHNGKSNGAHH